MNIFMVVKPFKQTSKVQQLFVWISRKSILTFWKYRKYIFELFGFFITLDFGIIHIFHCLGSHVGVIQCIYILHLLEDRHWGNNSNAAVKRP